ncbi:tetratricopeptide repeat protein [Microbacterium marinilacus]|uniref:Tetratricopeptide repeat protein n=1 Tax=Microbacterium marinilacus TaxID=415209 RepID=A0ABP7B423_9MICO|nr:tetratricopeptide repeat protein [Microbacterium marinilacus]MBY0687989.1 tetratricopeptide repeat protein [Microbacterium marinilacus]
MSDASSPLNAAALRGAVDLSSLRNRPAPGAAPSAPASSGGSSSLAFDATEQNFGEVLELSRRVPVVVALWSPRSGQVDAGLESAVVAQGGRLVLARIDVDANPQILQAFRPQSIPMAIALIGGQPVPLFAGPAPVEQLGDVFAQLLQLAEQNGVTGAVPAEGVTDGEDAPEEPPLPPLHAEAYAAIEEGDYDRAVAAYEKALKENPRDEDARAGLGQVSLLARVQGIDLHDARQAAAAAPRDVAAQLVVADLDVAGGHVDDAFDRLLELFAALPSDERAPVRERLVELFGVVGAADPRVVRARGRLTSLLY